MSISIKLLHKDDKGRYSFLVENVNYSFMNTIRRIIMSYSPVYAVDKVIYYKNESVMPDEFLANRLAMVPLRVKSGSGEEVKAYIRKKGGIVYSSDIISNDVEVPFKNIPLVKLKKGKELHLELIIKKGIGRKHSKWQPALVYYYNYPNIKVDKSKVKDLKALCPKKLFIDKNGSVVLEDPYKCDLCRYCKDFEGVDFSICEDKFVLCIELYKNKDIEDIFLDIDAFVKDFFKDLTKAFK